MNLVGRLSLFRVGVRFGTVPASLVLLAGLGIAPATAADPPVQSISGHVTEIGGAPLRHPVSVAVFASDLPPCELHYWGNCQVSGHEHALAMDGSYTVELPAAGDFRVIFYSDTDSPKEAYPRMYYTQFASGKTTAAEAELITVVDGQSVTGIDAQMMPLGSISGQVTSKYGELFGRPQARDDTHAFISAQRLDGTFAYRTFDGNGESGFFNFKLEGMLPGQYKIGFHDTADGFISSWYGGDDFDSAKVVTVEDNVDLSGVDGVIAKPHAPSLPTAVSAKLTGNRAEVRWQAPLDRGSSAINRYTVTSQPGDLQCVTTSTTSCVVADLVNGIAYRFAVTAENSELASQDSALSAPVTPRDQSDLVIRRQQRVAGAVKSKLQVRKSVQLPGQTTAGQRVRWRVTTASVCRIGAGHRLVAKRVGVCRVTAKAAGNARLLPLQHRFRVRIRS